MVLFFFPSHLLITKHSPEHEIHTCSLFYHFFLGFHHLFIRCASLTSVLFLGLLEGEESNKLVGFGCFFEFQDLEKTGEFFINSQPCFQIININQQPFFQKNLFGEEVIDES